MNHLKKLEPEVVEEDNASRKFDSLRGSNDQEDINKMKKDKSEPIISKIQNQDAQGQSQIPTLPQLGEQAKSFDRTGVKGKYDKIAL